MNTNDIEFYQSAIKSEECQCGYAKKPGLPFCFTCYKKVDHLVGELFRGGTVDKAEAYDEALKFLNE